MKRNQAEMPLHISKCHYVAVQIKESATHKKYKFLILALRAKLTPHGYQHLLGISDRSDFETHPVMNTEVQSVAKKENAILFYLMM